VRLIVHRRSTLATDAELDRCNRSARSQLSDRPQAASTPFLSGIKAVPRLPSGKRAAKCPLSPTVHSSSPQISREGQNSHGPHLDLCARRQALWRSRATRRGLLRFKRSSTGTSRASSAKLRGHPAGRRLQRLQQPLRPFEGVGHNYLGPLLEPLSGVEFYAVNHVLQAGSQLISVARNSS
jgi:hypothetical protein